MGSLKFEGGFVRIGGVPLSMGGLTLVEGAFQADAFSGFAFQIEHDVQFTITEKKDVASFSLSAQTSGSFSIQERKDTIAVTATSTTEATFIIQERKDTAAFELEATDERIIEFVIQERKDTAALDATAITYGSFFIQERRDVVAFDVVSTTDITFTITEKRDVASFRTFAAFFTDGDTDYIHLQPEQRTAIVPPQIDRVSVPYSMRASVPSENQRINVAQTQLQRKARE